MTGTKRSYQNVWNVCHVCNTKFEGRKDARFCSAKCKQQNHRNELFATHHDLPLRSVEHMDQQEKAYFARGTKKEEFLCAHCGTPCAKDGNRTNAIYCSDKCKQAAYRERKAQTSPQAEESIENGTRFVTTAKNANTWMVTVYRHLNDDTTWNKITVILRESKADAIKAARTFATRTYKRR